MISDIIDKLELRTVDGKLVVVGDIDLINVMTPAIKRWKPELIRIVEGNTVCDVGCCDHCGTDLLGMVVHGGYINRVCVTCGNWFQCLTPTGSMQELLRPIKRKRELTCAGEQDSVEYSKVAADCANNRRPVTQLVRS